MALKPTIYKFAIALSDIDRDYYDSLKLTVAQHPSETVERMLVRVLAFCLNAQEHLAFTKGLSSVDEPDLWCKTLDDRLILWVDVGEPDVERIRKSRRLADRVVVYTFNSKSEVWWSQVEDKYRELDVSVCRFLWPQVELLAAMVQRVMDISVTITGDGIYVASEQGEVELTWQVLQEAQ